MSKAGVIKGRGATDNPNPRYLTETRESVADCQGQDKGQGHDESEYDYFQGQAKLKTVVHEEQAKTIISRNRSPDIPFEQSINPYRGCEHGCIYCYARPSHAFLDLSPGLDFESRLFAKTNAASLLTDELNRPGYQCTPISLGANTDPYQPIERTYGITRQIIDVLSACQHPLMIVTKSALVERDIDLLAPMAEQGLVEVHLSITTLRSDLARRLEPRATAPLGRLEALQKLSDNGIPCGVLFAPVIPALNDEEMEAVCEKASTLGARYAGYVLLRLPLEVNALFQGWLAQHEPLKAKRIMNLIREMRGGKENDPRFGTRMRGQGLFAELIRQRFQRACKSFALNRSDRRLDTSKFRPPDGSGIQLSLFG